MAPLNRTVAYARSPRRAIVVGDHLDFDMPSSFHELFKENRGISEGFESLRACALECLWKLAGLQDSADSVASAAGRCFDEKWKAEAVRVRQCILECLNRPIAPGCDIDLRLLR